MSPTVRQIALPQEFFVKERETGYAEWRVAFCREFLSNSLDAIATRFEILETEDGWLTFTDNGLGMSRSVCEEIYLSIGRSSKSTEEGSVGGFGRARILTCFSMKAYEIHGDGYIVRGVGANYTIEDGPAIEQGLTVKVLPDVSEDWIYHFRKALAPCDLPTFQVFYNMVELQPTPPEISDWVDLHLLPLGEAAPEFFGKAAYLEADKEKDNFGFPPGLSLGSVTIRVNGMVMFSTYRYLDKGHLVVELSPTTARKWLTANRDGLRNTGWAPIDKLIKEIKSEGLNAAKSKVERAIQFCGDMRQLKSMRGDEELIEMDYADEKGPSMDGHEAARTEARYSQNGYFDRPMVLHINTANPAFSAIASMWRPGLETPAMRNFYRAWEDCCILAVETLMKTYPHKNGLWAPGLTFSDGVRALAMHLRLERRRVFFCLVNPFDDDLNIRHKYRTQPGAQELLAEAMHEVAHHVEEYHDTDYATVLTEMLARVDFRHFEAARKGW